MENTWHPCTGRVLENEGKQGLILDRVNNIKTLSRNKKKKEKARSGGPSQQPRGCGGTGHDGASEYLRIRKKTT